MSAVLLALCFPPFDVPWVVWIGLVPLLAVLWADPKSPGGRGGFGWGYLCGFVFFSINLKWLHANEFVPPVGVVVLHAYLAIYFGVFGAFAGTVGRWRRGDGGKGFFAASWPAIRSAFLCAAAWTGLEWARGYIFTGFGWNGLGVSFHDELAMAQAADVVGVSGLAFAVVFFNVVIYATVVRLADELREGRPRPHFDFMTAVVLVALQFLYGVKELTRPVPEEVTELRTLIVQGNIPQGQKWDPDKVHENYRVYDDLTRLNMESAEFDLVIWPESALYFPLFHGMNFHKEVMNPLLAMQDISLITGVNEDALDEGDFNAMAIFYGDVETFEVYRKVHLVPFGEFIPGRDWFPPARWLAERVMRFEFDAGTETEPLPLANSKVEVIPMICFEDTVGRLMRKFVREAPQLMVNVTNDGWFGETEAAAQHLANAKFRCIELRRPMVRSTNNGVSAVIDEIGSLYHRGAELAAGERVISDPETGATFIRGFMADTIAVPNAPRTPVYAKVGDVFAVGCLVVAMGGAIVGWWKRRA